MAEKARAAPIAVVAEIRKNIFYILLIYLRSLSSAISFCLRKHIVV